jgi:hypothetical protein
MATDANGATNGKPLRPVEGTEEKCARSYGADFTIYRSGPLTHRPLRNLLQIELQNQVALIPPIVAEAVLVKVGLQILCAYKAVHAADPAPYKNPETLNRIGTTTRRSPEMGNPTGRQRMIRRHVISGSPYRPKARS